MKKNGQYVGVDEKYVPNDEKYVDNNLNSEIKDDIHNMYKGAKEYASDKENQEKMKKAGRTGLKIAKGIGIGYLAIICFSILMVIIIFVVVFSQMFKVRKQTDEVKDTASSIINDAYNKVNEASEEADVKSFNSNLESYSGTKYGSSVITLLDNVIIKIKKNSNHTISVVYNDTTTSNPDEITTLKKQFDSSIQYEVSIDYDVNGYINKITISEY